MLSLKLKEEIVYKMTTLIKNLWAAINSLMPFLVSPEIPAPNKFLSKKITKLLTKINIPRSNKTIVKTIISIHLLSSRQLQVYSKNLNRQHNRKESYNVVSPKRPNYHKKSNDTIVVSIIIFLHFNFSLPFTISLATCLLFLLSHKISQDTHFLIIVFVKIKSVPVAKSYLEKVVIQRLL